MTKSLTEQTNPMKMCLIECLVIRSKLQLFHSLDLDLQSLRHIAKVNVLCSRSLQFIRILKSIHNHTFFMKSEEVNLAIFS